MRSKGRNSFGRDNAVAVGHPIAVGPPSNLERRLGREFAHGAGKAPLRREDPNETRARTLDADGARPAQHPLQATTPVSDTRKRNAQTE
jgi:hypothetical protein